MTTKQWRCFYEEIEKSMDKKVCNHHIVKRDFNAKIGVRNINENMKCIGPFGTGDRNEKEKDSWILLKKTTW